MRDRDKTNLCFLTWLNMNVRGIRCRRKLARLCTTSLCLASSRRALHRHAASALSFPVDLTDQMILAPLTRGGNLPYRRLCADLGCRISMSEMVYARSLLRGDAVERARLRRAPNEECFGVQIATNNAEEGRKAMELIHQAGTADFVDLNCGCPIREATRRGLGSSLLRSPKKLARLVNGMTEGSELPLTVKIRLGCEDDTINIEELVPEVMEAGAAAVTIHGRTAQQRYSKACDWDKIQQAVADNSGSGVPIIGNGDILTHYEAKMRLEQSGVDAVMVGRGALMKPWIFEEFNQGASYSPDAPERIGIYRTLATYMKDHFGDDDMGKKKAFNFLPWHFEFLCRYVDLPERDWAVASRETPLIQSRIVPEYDDMPPLEQLLTCRNKETHQRISHILWDSSCDADAVQSLTEFAESSEFRNIQAAEISNGQDASTETEELANIPSRMRNDDRRRGRNPKPKRTPEEIRIIRAERAAKKAAAAAANGENGGTDKAVDVPSGPLKDQKGKLKRWITGRSGQFGFVGIQGTKSEWIVFEEGLALGDDFLPIDESRLPLSIIFDTEVASAADDGSGEVKSDRAVNVRLA